MRIPLQGYKGPGGTAVDLAHGVDHRDGDKGVQVFQPELDEPRCEECWRQVVVRLQAGRGDLVVAQPSHAHAVHVIDGTRPSG